MEAPAEVTALQSEPYPSFVSSPVLTLRTRR